MITYLKGRLIDKHPPTLVVENNDIGYLIQASMQSFYQLPALGQEVLLYTLLFIKEDTQWLYGFVHPDERKLFQELLKVNTIGPKAALAILSSMDVFHLYQAVTHQDIRALQNIPGIGKKTGERLLLELTNRLNYWKPGWKTDSSSTNKEGIATLNYTEQQDAIDALISLGYKSPMATKLINEVADGANHTTEELIKLALAQLRKA